MIKMAHRFSQLSREIVRIYFHYNKTTGILSWRKHPRHKCSLVEGEVVAGYVYNPGPNQKIVVCFNGKVYDAHVLIWWWMRGYVPKGKTIHKNGNKMDNRFSNLTCESPKGKRIKERKS